MNKTKQTSKPTEIKKSADNEKTKREAENFKRRYFDYYDDIKISVKEDW